MKILRESALVLTIGFLVFFGISTIFPEAGFVGSFGKFIGGYNRLFFGYFSFIYPFLLILPSILLYRKFYNSQRTLEIFLALLLIFADILMIQANVFTGSLQGSIGFSIVDTLKKMIGSFGVWVFIIVILVLALNLLLNEGIEKIIKKSFIENNNFDDLSFKNENKSTTKTSKQISAKKKEKEEEAITIEVVVADQILEDETNEKRNNETKKTLLLDEVEENKKLLEEIEKGEQEKPKDFVLPPLKFLRDPPKKVSNISESEIDKKISDLLDKLRRFNIDGDVVRTYTGPVVTTFEFKPAPHIKVSKIMGLQDDLAMALRAQTIRIQAPIPGKDVVGIEIPNKDIQTIFLKDILNSDIYKNASSPLTVALGKDIVGNPFITDIKKLPHLLIAGTTGSGKSVGINAMLVSLLYRNSPDTLKLMMIDPKMLEFSMYNGIPHLLTPVITQSKQAITALSNMVLEMERRYQVMSHSRTKNIESYNEKAKKDNLETMPYIVVIIDELADLMMTSGKDVEVYIGRLAQMARASGIHLIVATQRPSVDVVTGLIKANLPSRISYKVGQRIDSKVILDSLGAESLLGKGDMLFTPPSSSGLIRLHAPLVSESEIEKIVEHLKSQREVKYNEKFLKDPNSSSQNSSGNIDDLGDIDELFEDAKNIILSEGKASISYIQRRLQIGYNRAARIIEQLEKMGILSEPNSKGQREIIK